MNVLVNSTYRYLGYMFLDYRHHAMFPDDFHKIYSSVWLLQSILLLVSSVLSNRFLPSSHPPNSNSILSAQYDFALITHTLFYLIELSITNMYEVYTGMLFHHIFAIILFAFLLKYKSYYCASTTLPFIMHQVFWLDGADSIPMLICYNIVLMTTAILSIIKIKVYLLNCGLSVSVMCLMIVSVNLYIYCDSMPNSVCPKRTSYLGDYQYDLTAWVVSFYFIVLSSTLSFSRVVRSVFLKSRVKIKNQ